MTTYVIAQVIYGYELNIEHYKETTNLIFTIDLLKLHFAKHTLGFLEFKYHQNTPRAFGILLDSFSQESSISISELCLEANDETKSEFQNLIDALEPSLQVVLRNIKPREFILWTTSEPDLNAIMRELMIATYNYAYSYECWNYTGSLEDAEKKAYNNTLLDELKARYNLPNFAKSSDGKLAYNAAYNAFFKKRQKDRKDFNVNYTKEDGLEKLLESLI